MEIPRIPSGMCVSVSPYSFGSPAGLMRTDLEGGVGRYGLSYDRGTQTFNVTLMLTLERFTIWNAFFLRKISRGAITFLMEIDSGMGPEDHRCNILPGTYTATLTSGTMYAVAFQVEAEAYSTWNMTDAEIDALLELNEITDGFPRRLLDRLAQFANVDTNVLNF